ncbi:MAG: twin-arginine translocase subunit TatC, partial [Pseudobdellovibrionaceae bacterium]
MTQNEQHDSTAMSLVDHLTELRKRLLYSIYAVAATSILAYNYSDKIFDIVRKPIAPFLHGQGLVFTGVMDKFVAYLKVTLVAGIILACPFLIYQLWKFIAPGLYSKERKYTLGFIFTGSILFLAGVAFAYFAVYPIAFEFLLTFGGNEDTPMITINEYLSF